MKKISVPVAALVFAFVCLAALAPSFVSAHDLQFSGTIGALLHIEPGDSAVAGQPATLVFHFVDTQKKFLPEQCECEVSVTNSDGKKIFSAVLDPDDQSAGDDTRLTTFTFPKIDIYKVAIVGTPLDVQNSAVAATFSPFTISYDVRVEQEGSAAGGASGGTSGSGWWSRAMHGMHGGMMGDGATGAHNAGFFGGHGLHICLFVLAIGVTIGIVIRDKRREKRYTEPQLEDK